MPITQLRTEIATQKLAALASSGFSPLAQGLNPHARWDVSAGQRPELVGRVGLEPTADGL